MQVHKKNVIKSLRPPIFVSKYYKLITFIRELSNSVKTKIGNLIWPFTTDYVHILVLLYLFYW